MMHCDAIAYVANANREIFDLRFELLSSPNRLVDIYGSQYTKLLAKKDATDRVGAHVTRNGT
jgi:hypothetical protein